MKKLLAILLSFGLIILGSCYYDKEELLYPGGPCDSSNTTYSGAVLTSLQTYGCIGCHSGAAPSGNISLEGFANVKASAQSGKLYGSISHAAGYKAMPQGNGKMSDCVISKIKAWIDGGTLNN
jgi:hypothetical protein